MLFYYPVISIYFICKDADATEWGKKEFEVYRMEDLNFSQGNF